MSFYLGDNFINVIRICYNFKIIKPQLANIGANMTAGHSTSCYCVS